jgi:hypothetical protein
MKLQPAADIFRFPYNTWSPERILAYYQTRKSVRCYVAVDETLTSRETADAVLDGWFTFNGETHHLPDEFDWTHNPSRDLEWLILLHKFYYAVGLGRAFHETGDERYAQRWMALTRAWAAQVPFDFLPGDVAGRRIQNWIFAHHYFVVASRARLVSSEFHLGLLRSIHAQVSWLIEHLTPARNHRTLELYAVFLAAVIFPEMKHAAAWLEFARIELLKNLRTDLLPDGVQCELSTDYHHIVLRNFLAVRRLAQLNRIELPAELDRLIRKALRFALWAHRPDGLIPAISDGDQAGFLKLLAEGDELYGCDELRYVATQGREGVPPAERSKVFSSSGYCILRSSWGDGDEPYEDARYLFFDCGPLGAGNHGHLDLLGFEMAAYGQPLIVDPGRYTYDESGATNWRVLFRGTAYHNTVQVDGRNQTRYEFHKRKYRIRGPEPEPELKCFVSREGFDYLHGVARSYEYDAVHERKIFFLVPEYWLITDLLRAESSHRYDLFFHLSERAWGRTALKLDPNGLLVEAPHLVMAQPADERVTAQIECGWVSPSYGIKHQAPVVRFTRAAGNACFSTILYPWKNERPEIAVTSLAVTADDQPCEEHQASALCITLNEWRDYFFTAHQTGDCIYQFADFTFQGQLLFVRRDSRGEVVLKYAL